MYNYQRKKKKTLKKSLIFVHCVVGLSKHATVIKLHPTLIASNYCVVSCVFTLLSDLCFCTCYA